MVYEKINNELVKIREFDPLTKKVTLMNEAEVEKMELIEDSEKMERVETILEDIVEKKVETILEETILEDIVEKVEEEVIEEIENTIPGGNIEVQVEP